MVSPPGFQSKANSAIYSAGRVVIHAETTVAFFKPPPIWSRVTLNNPSYRTPALLKALGYLIPARLVDLCILTPLPVLLVLPERLSLLQHVYNLSLAIPAHAAGVPTGSVDLFSWTRLEKLIKMVLSLGRYPELKMKTISFPQSELAARLRQEITSRGDLLAALQTLLIRVLDHEGLDFHAQIPKLA